VLVEGEPVGGDPLDERVDLAVDGAFLGLLIGRDACVEGNNGGRDGHQETPV
jgi:hypothetical protein